MTDYTVHYRCGIRDGRTALIVEDGRGDAYLFSGGLLQARHAGSGACARSASVLGRGVACAPVPAAAPHTLDDLRRLTAPTARMTPAAVRTVVA